MCENPLNSLFTPISGSSSSVSAAVRLLSPLISHPQVCPPRGPVVQIRRQLGHPSGAWGGDGLPADPCPLTLSADLLRIRCRVISCGVLIHPCQGQSCSVRVAMLLHSREAGRAFPSQLISPMPACTGVGGRGVSALLRRAQQHLPGPRAAARASAAAAAALAEPQDGVRGPTSVRASV